MSYGVPSWRYGKWERRGELLSCVLLCAEGEVLFGAYEGPDHVHYYQHGMVYVSEFRLG